MLPRPCMTLHRKKKLNVTKWQLSLCSHFSVIVSPLSFYQYSVCICLCAEAQSNAIQCLTDGWLMRRWCSFKGVAKRRKCRCAIKMQIIKICIQLIPSSAGSGNIDVFVMKTPWSIAPVFSRAVAALKISRVIISGFSLQQLYLCKCHLSNSLCVLEILILVYTEHDTTRFNKCCFWSLSREVGGASRRQLRSYQLH